MQYALFEDIKNHAKVDAKPVASGKQAETVDITLRPSAAAEAGLNGFGIAAGRSGQRYVFAQTTVEQAMLYDMALFAVGTLESGVMTVSTDVLSLWFDGIPDTMSLFVHILDADDKDCARILDDLRG